jgi:hypothetical protein
MTDDRRPFVGFLGFFEFIDFNPTKPKDPTNSRNSINRTLTSHPLPLTPDAQLGT